MSIVIHHPHPFVSSGTDRTRVGGQENRRETRFIDEAVSGSLAILNRSFHYVCSPENGLSLVRILLNTLCNKGFYSRGGVTPSLGFVAFHPKRRGGGLVISTEMASMPFGRPLNHWDHTGLSVRV